MNRKEEKIEEIEKYIEELGSVLPFGFNDYENDFKLRAFCERYFEKIIEAIVDLAFIIIKDKKLEIPEEDKGAFDILFREKIISSDLAEKLKKAKGMRNILAHEYGKIDDEIVFEAVTEELIYDAVEFLKRVK